VSPSSPVTGSADGEPAAAEPADEPAAGDALEIELEAPLQRAIGWTIGGIIVGALLIWKLGTVGKWGGAALILTGLYHAWHLIAGLRNPPGTIVVGPTEVSLPRGLSMSRPVRVKPAEITAVYFLRRSVPWNHVSPVLVVELGATAMAFPNNWFASEADQRRVVHALLRHLPSAAKAKAKAGDAEPAAAG
jgi:hypothetical protein